MYIKFIVNINDIAITIEILNYSFKKTNNKPMNYNIVKSNTLNSTNFNNMYSCPNSCK
jgi:hypothetical protein